MLQWLQVLEEMSKTKADAIIPAVYLVQQLSWAILNSQFVRYHPKAFMNVSAALSPDAQL